MADKCPLCEIEGKWLLGEENDCLKVAGKTHYVGEEECKDRQLQQIKKIEAVQRKLIAWYETDYERYSCEEEDVPEDLREIEQELDNIRS